METVGRREDFNQKGLARFFPVYHELFILYYGNQGWYLF